MKMSRTHRLTKPLKISVVGATGIVGKEFLKILEQRDFPVENLKLFASQKSAGEKVTFRKKSYVVEALSVGCFKGDDVAFFSAGADISKEWGPRAVQEGAYVIDNSSAFRMDENTALVVPEVNANRIPKNKPAIIANPNCSTIQLVVALKPLHDNFGLKEVTVATYQSVSGAGKEGQDELSKQTATELQAWETRGGRWEPSEHEKGIFAHPIAFNNLPHIDKFDDNGYTHEELKVVNETRKIMEIPELPVAVTAVRTPTMNSHSEAVWVELNREVKRDEIMAALKNAPGVALADDPKSNLYPLNRMASGHDEVYVGRVRRDLSNPKRWALWVVSDNVRKGAALNGIQIAEELFSGR
jgi:aspartate-semialdehyde dehydrogenase